MNTAMTDTAWLVENVRKQQKYGKSGGRDNHGILTDIQADDLPDETLLEFSAAPYTFEESALLVMEDMEKLHYLAGTANRFSDKYLKCLPQLEKYISKAGSFCLTKAVLEQKGFSFPELENLNTLDLIGRVSFHIRKCHAAIDGLYRDNDRLGFVYLQWELRWINLGERLKSTEAKIQKIQNGELKADTLLQREDSFRNRTESPKEIGNEWSKRPFLNPASLPLLTSMASDMLRKERIIEKQKRDYERAEERALRALGIHPYPPMPIPTKPVVQPDEKPAPEPHPVEEEIPEGMITEGEARRILIEEALRHGDQQAVLEIQKEDSDAFARRWERHLDETDLSRKRAGPSDAKRKKLREKRKKKK